MKLVFLRIHSAKERIKNFSGMRMEKFLFFSFIISFFLLVVIQTAMIHPSIRTFLTVNEEYEGSPLQAEEYLFRQGEIILQLQGNHPNENIRILVNGDDAGSFKNSSISMRVKEGDVIEIDGSKSKAEETVQITALSKEITPGFLNQRVTVKGNIKKLLKIKFE